MSDDVDRNTIPDECNAGLQLPGDCNGDGSVNVSDPMCVFGFLFFGKPGAFPCGDGTFGSPSNFALLDAQPDGRVDISDVVLLLQSLFFGGPPHHLLSGGGATESGCVSMEDCPDGPACP